jgi:hypothetical protein
VLFTATPGSGNQRNSWVMVHGGDVPNPQWFRLYPQDPNAGAIGFINMYTTFAAAKQMNSIVDFEVFDQNAGDLAGMIFQVYGW